MVAAINHDQQRATQIKFLDHSWHFHFRQSLKKLAVVEGLLGTLSNDDDNGSENVALKNEFAFLQT